MMRGGMLDVISARFGIYPAVLDGSMNVSVCDTAFSSYLGLSETISGAPLSEVFPETVGLEEEILKVLHGRADAFTIHTINRVPEHDIFFNLHFFSYREREDAALIVIEDVTESSISIRSIQQKRNEMILKNLVLVQREWFIKTLIDTIPNPLYYVDDEGRYLGCNRAFEEWFGVSKGVILGKHHREVHPPGKDPVEWARGEEPARDLPHEVRLANGSGDMRYVIINRAMFPSDERFSGGEVGVISDITERRLMEDRIARSEQELRNRNSVMQHNLSVARKIIDVLMQKEVPSDGRVTAGYRYLPLDEIGGDYFSIRRMDGSICFFICDITGHGVASALFLALVKYFSDRLFEEHAAEPGRYMTSLNTALIGCMASYFISGIYGTISPRADTVITFANGAHPSPIVVSGDGTARFLYGNDTIVGFFKNAAYQEHVAVLSPGDMLFLYTDGIPETRNANNEIIGFGDGLLSLFTRSRRQGLSGTLDAIIGCVAAFRGDESIDDDILLVGFEVR